jgi:hypothetical protein
MANRILPGYLAYVGDKIEITIDHDGPASYNNTGTFNTSGDIINASDLGLGGFEDVNSDGVSSDGLNYAFVEYRNGGSGNAIPFVVVHWFVLATNVEVANAQNLSTKSLRLRLRGV